MCLRYLSCLLIGEGKDTSTVQRRFSRLMDSFMARMRIEPFSMGRFVLTDMKILDEVKVGMFPDEPERPTKIAKTEAFEDEHFALFRASGFDYPPPKEQSICGYEMRYDGLSIREQELAIFCHKIFPNEKNDMFGFVDINQSMGVLTLPKRNKGGGKDGTACLLNDVRDGTVKLNNPWQVVREWAMYSYPTSAADTDQSAKGLVRPLMTNHRLGYRFLARRLHVDSSHR